MEEVLQEELEKDHEGYCRFWDIFGRVMRPALRLVFGYRGEMIPKLEGPALILYNHTTDLDFAFVSASSKTKGYFVITSTVERKGRIGKWAAKRFHLILHDKGGSGIDTARTMLERLKWGYGIVLAPEGNRSFNGETCPIPASTGKLARISGATLVTYRISGGYLTTPRWGRGIRRGRMQGRVMGIYSPETLKAMSAREVSSQVEKDLAIDAFDEQKAAPVRFRNRNRAEYLETLIYLCPHCRSFDTMLSKGDGIRCSCGYSMKYTGYGYLEDPSGRKCTVAVLDKGQKRVLKDIVSRNDGRYALFSDRLVQKTVEKDGRLTERREVTLTAYKDHIKIDDLEIPWEKLQAVTIVQRNMLILHIKGHEEHFEYTGSPRFNAVKYMDLFSAVKE